VRSDIPCCGKPLRALITIVPVKAGYENTVNGRTQW
jgi:hypothetical protein